MDVSERSMMTTGTTGMTSTTSPASTVAGAAAAPIAASDSAPGSASVSASVAGPGSASVVQAPHRDHHERGIWRGTFVVFNLVVLGSGLAVLGALPLAALVLTQGSLLGLLLIPVLTWMVGTAVVAAVHAVHGQDLTTDTQPLRRLLRGLRQSWRQAAALWLPVGILAGLMSAAAALQGRPGPDAAGLAVLAVVAVLALIGSVVAARFTAGGVALWRYALGAVGISVRGVLGIVLVAVVCVLLVAVIGEWVLLFAAAPLAVLLDRSAAPLLTALERNGGTR